MTRVTIVTNLAAGRSWPGFAGAGAGTVRAMTVHDPGGPPPAPDPMPGPAGPEPVTPIIPDPSPSPEPAPDA